MFKNKVTILITVGVLVAIAVGLQFINDKENNFPDTIRVIPEDAAIVFETGNFVDLVKNMNNKNLFQQEFYEVDLLRPFFQQIEKIDSLLEAQSGLKSLIEGNQVIISGHVAANNQLDFLYTVPVKKEKYKELIKETIAEMVGGSKNVTARMYEDELIYDVYPEMDETFSGFTYTIVNDIFIYSQSRILTEEAVRHLNTGSSLANDKGFLDLVNAAGKNADAHIYLNYKNLPFALSSVLSAENQGINEFLKEFAAWTEFDLVYKNDAFLMSGFTYSNDTLSHYVSIFRNQSALKNEFLSALPENTSAFIAFNLSNPTNWRKSYVYYLQKAGEYVGYNNYFEIISKQYNTDFRDLFYNNIEGAVCISWAPRNVDGGGQDIFGILELRDEEAMLAALGKIKTSDTTNQESTGQTEAITSGTIGFFPESSVFRHLFGNAFAPLKSNYYTFSDGRLIFAQSASALTNYLRKVKDGTRLTDDAFFANFSKSLASESNIYAYLNFPASKSMIEQNLANDYKKTYDNNAAKFNKIQALSIQYGISGKRIFSNFYMNFNPQFVRKSGNIWEIQLDTAFSMKPQIVKNHYTGNGEVILQDNANRLVLINEEGKILWKKKIKGKILGSIHQIDKYKNNKLQYFFNTGEELHLIDRNGDNVDGFPIKFKSPATNGIAVFDYDNNRDYRVLVACANKNVYLLSVDGGKIAGWDFGLTKGFVSQPAQHFVENGKDYIVFADETTTYIVNRRGETRITPKAGFAKSPYTPFYFEKGVTEAESRFVTTGKNGDVYFIFIDGTVKKLTIDGFTENHRFEYADLNGDGKNCLIYTEKNRLYVYNLDKSVRFEKKFDSDLKNSLNLYQFGEGIKYIGVSPFGSNELFLINPDGKIVKGFPMQGNGPFSIAKLNLSDNTDDLNLIAGNSDNILFNYRLAIK